MTLLARKRATLPSLVNDFFDTGKLFPEIFDFDRDIFKLSGKSLVIPDANIVENHKDFKIELAAPGLERKDFKVEVEDGILTISSEKEEEKKEEHKNYWKKEFSYNSFSRSFKLPDNSLPDKVEAKYENGILNVTVPKKEVTPSKPVKEIKVS